MKSIASVLKSESEYVAGVDAYNIPLVECPEFKPTAVKSVGKMTGKQWYVCPECLSECFHEIQGKTYYHKKSCSHSNGIGYGDERIEEPGKNVRPNSWFFGGR